MFICSTDFLKMDNFGQKWVQKGHRIRPNDFSIFLNFNLRNLNIFRGNPEPGSLETLG